MTRRKTQPNRQVLPQTPDGTVVVGANSVVSVTTLGFTVTHHEVEATMATTAIKTMIGETSHVNNVHLNAYGVSPSIQSTAGGAITWTDLDTRLGYKVGGPTGINDYGGQLNGWFRDSPSGACCLTALGCPNYMRFGSYVDGSPLNNDPQSAGFNAWKIGTLNTTDTSTSNLDPPHRDFWQAYADLLVLALRRYPHIQYLQVWNELKGWYSNSLNRWWYEGYTRFYNVIWDAVQAAKTAGLVRSDFKMGGPYPVFSTYGWDQTAKMGDLAEADKTNRLASSDGTPPTTGWGAADKSVLDVIKYWIRHAKGTDYLVLDVRNGNKDYEVYDYYQQITDGITNGTGHITSASGKFLPDHANGWPSDEHLIVTAPTNVIPVGAIIMTYISPNEIVVGTNTNPPIEVSIPTGGARTVRWGGTLTKAWPHASSYHWPMDPWDSAIKKQKIRDWIKYLAEGATVGVEPYATYGDHSIVIDGVTVTKNHYNGVSNDFDIRTKPIWWSEWYANPRTDMKLISSDPFVPSSNQEALSGEVWNMIDDIKARDAHIMKWKMVGGEHNVSDRGHPIALFDRDTSASTILRPMMKFIKDNFSPGTQLKAVTISHTSINALVSATHILAVSKSASPLAINVDGNVLSFGAYDVKYITR